MQKRNFIICFFVIVTGMLFLTACGGETGKSTLKEGEIPELVEVGSNSIHETADIINNFTHLHFNKEYLDDNYIDMIYEVKGEEDIEGEKTEKIYVKIDFLNSHSSGYEYDFWVTDSGEVPQAYSYESDYMNKVNGDEILDEVLEYFVEPFDYFDDTYREALQEGLWSIREMEVEKDQVAGHDVKVHSYYGKHDITFDDEAEFNLVILEFDDFEFTLESEDTTAFGTNQRYEIKEMKRR